MSLRINPYEAIEVFNKDDKITGSQKENELGMFPRYHNELLVKVL